MTNQSHFDKAHALASSVIGFEFEFFSDMVRGRIIESLSKLLGKKIIKEFFAYLPLLKYLSN